MARATADEESNQCDDNSQVILSQNHGANPSGNKSQDNSYICCREAYNCCSNEVRLKIICDVGLLICYRFWRKGHGGDTMEKVQ